MNKQELFSRSTLFTGIKQLDTLQDSTVLVAGVGGLGCVVSHLLVRRGIGKIILLDCKDIDLPDLNRQMLYTSEDLGRNKVDAATDFLQKVHPYTEVEKVNAVISDSNEFSDIISKLDFDLIADCLDNYESRFVLEKFLRNESQFLVHGGVSHDFGQVTSIRKGMSMRSLYSGVTESEGVIPVIPEIVNIIGSLMVKEIINCLSNEPELLQKLLIMELSDFSSFIVDWC